MLSEPAKGLKVIDFSHMLAGPLAARRLSDLGARVIKVEPVGGEALRKLPPSERHIDSTSLYFHAFNSGKESITLDMTSDVDLELATKLASEADVVIQSFRPGVLQKFGLDYESISSANEKVVYGSISGYGGVDDWQGEPGQDLLAQARSGVMWLSGEDNGIPVPLGFLVADTTAANILCQGILAALVGRGISGRGAHVETSLLEGLIELQTDALALYLNELELPQRSKTNWGASVYGSAPYGVYPTLDGFIVIANLSPEAIAEMLGEHAKSFSPFDKGEVRDTAHGQMADRTRRESTSYWTEWIAKRNGWSAEVLNWNDIKAASIFDKLGILKRIPKHGPVVPLAPMRFNGLRPQTTAAPEVNDAGARIRESGWD